MKWGWDWDWDLELIDLPMLLQVLSSAQVHPTCDDTCVDMGAPLGYLGVVS